MRLRNWQRFLLFSQALKLEKNRKLLEVKCMIHEESHHFLIHAVLSSLTFAHCTDLYFISADGGNCQNPCLKSLLHCHFSLELYAG